MNAVPNVNSVRRKQFLSAEDENKEQWGKQGRNKRMLKL
jgi:hypothetical protein